MRVWCAQGVLDVYSGGVGACTLHRGALAANHQQAHSLKVRMSATTREEEARVGNHSTAAAVLVTVAKPPPPLTPIRPRLHIPHCPGGLLR